MSVDGYVPVADFYAGRSVFLTGFSGFLGKVILEKLLYSCKDIDKVYVMIRRKDGASAEQRFHDILDRPIFTRLKDERPQDLHKIVPVIGDLTLPNLGIDNAVEDSFVNKVSVVIHSGAAIKYNQRLDEALNNNLEGTRRVLDLCRRMPNIASLVHVSTAYANMERKEIDEVVYPTPITAQDVFHSITQHGVANQGVIKKILNGKPNTYVFTKALAEDMLVEQHGDIPTTIVRPSTVCAAINEPLPGWVDNWFAATGVIHVSGSGYIRAIYGSGSYILDMIPVDYVSNLVVVAAARNKKGKDIPVYNCCSSSSKPISYRQLSKYGRDIYISNRYYDLYPTVMFTQKKWLLNFVTSLTAKLPAKLGDVYRKAKGKKPKYAKLLSKIIEARDIQSDFTGNSWIIKSAGARTLFSSLSAEDKQKFPFDPVLIDWRKYVPAYCRGIRRFLLRK